MKCKRPGPPEGWSRFRLAEMSEVREQNKKVRAPATYQFGELSVSVNADESSDGQEHAIVLSCTPESSGPFLYEHLLFIVHHIDLLFRRVRTLVDLSHSAGMLSIIANSVGIPRISAYARDPSVLEHNLQRNCATASVWRDLEREWTERAQLVYLDFHAFPSLALMSRAVANLEGGGRLAITGLIQGHRKLVLGAVQPACRLVRETWINEWTALVVEKRRGSKR